MRRKWLIVLFIGAGVVLFASGEWLKYQQSSRTKKFRETLKRVGFTLAPLEEPYVEALPESRQITNDELAPYVIWKGRKVQAYLTPRPYEPHHVLLSTEGQGSVLPLDQEALEEMETLRYRLGQVYRDLLGVPHYLLFSHSQPREDQPLGTISWHMLPTPRNDGDAMAANLEKKLRNTCRVLFGPRPGDLRVRPPSDKVLNQFRVAMKNLEKATISGQPESGEPPTYPREYRWVAVDGARKLLVTELNAFLNPRGMTLRPLEKPVEEGHDVGEAEFAVNGEMKRVVRSCAFCAEKVVDRQAVVRGNHVNLLFNYLPYRDGFHFLLTPKIDRHVENWQELTAAELEEAHQLTAALEKVMKEMQPHDSSILFVQNGFPAGQTVPHTHAHLLLQPEPFSFFLRIVQELVGTGTGPLKDEELREIIERFRERLEVPGKQSSIAS